MSEEDVRTLLGPPDQQFTAQNAPGDYYIDGYSYKRREISGKVLIYRGAEHVAYFYIDNSSRVEDVFVGGS
jgi:hypothetical protein